MSFGIEMRHVPHRGSVPAGTTWRQFHLVTT
jgi:hypothetical protein